MSRVMISLCMSLITMVSLANAQTLSSKFERTKQADNVGFEIFVKMLSAHGAEWRTAALENVICDKNIQNQKYWDEMTEIWLNMNDDLEFTDNDDALAAILVADGHIAGYRIGVLEGTKLYAPSIPGMKCPKNKKSKTK